jgi:tetratricopeptide (TPR) repeat protein
VLYELLTGGKAHQVRSLSPLEWQRVVCETDVPRPSESVPPDLPGAPRLRRQLRGDLDNIVLTAMRKEPQRRYSSVDEFANDVRRFLANRPVRARRDSVGYRARKFVVRHVVSLGLTSLLASCLIGGALLSIHEARGAEAARQLAETRRLAADAARRIAESERTRADAERDIAVRERSRASEEASRSARRLSEMVALANHSLFEIHSQIERLPGATEARRQIVGTTLEFLESLSRDAAGDEPLRLALGSAYLKLGDVQGYPYGPSLGDGGGALKSYQAGSALPEPLHRSRPGDPDVLVPWVETQRRVAALLAESGKAEDAIRLLRRAVPDAVRLRDLRPDDPEAVVMEGLLAHSLAGALRKRNSADALVWAQRALVVFARLSARFPERESLLETLGDQHSQIGAIFATQGQLRAALNQFEQGAHVRERLLAARPDDVMTRRNLMLAYAHLADVLGNPYMVNLGETEAARRYYRKAVALAEQNVLADEQNRAAQYDLAAARFRLGAVDVPESGLAASLETLRQAAAAFETLSLASPRDLRYKQELATAEEYIANRLLALSRGSEAVVFYRKSLAAANAILAIDPMSRPAHSQALAAGRGLAVALATLGDREGALAQARETIARAQAGAAVRPEKNLNALYAAKGWLTLAAVHHVFSDWNDVRAAAERALREAAGGAGDIGLLQASAEAQRLLAECRGKD